MDPADEQDLFSALPLLPRPDTYDFAESHADQHTAPPRILVTGGLGNVGELGRETSHSACR